MSTIVKFAGKSYHESAAGVVAKGPGFVNVTDLTGPQLIELYNLVSSNLGRGRVKRFADTKSAIRRTWTILQEYAAQPEDDQHDDLQDDSEMVSYENKVQLSETDKAQVADEAAARKPAELPKSEQLLQAAAAARAAPSGRGNVWRRKKREEPSKIAYKPRPGTLQGQMYDGLTREGGISMEDFCDLVEKSGSKDKMMYTPSGVWGGLRYLFVTLRGYGLDFDGNMLKLLVPGDERTPQPLKGGNK